ncbi:MAG: tRNA (adenosine(37)-N6)-threonylcarbamoyltransferase complex dimerization subunit type 1 TsaB [Bacteroidales bacterium]|nr:tRNA (adenosine(37)-N6)-threonylcarbamoyltransferase complex dimerization subunit type 1 TsaB [Bacteroidales bacterium]
MDKYVLLIETATDSCSVALSKNSEIISEKFINEPKAHASVIGGYVTDILAENSIAMADCSAVAVSKGPGSYTGLRVGVSIAKGLCYGAGKPLISVCTLATIAQMALDNNLYTGEGDFTIIPMIDARRMEVYTANFSSKGEQLTPVEAKILDENSYAAELAAGPVLFTGNGAEKFKELVGNNPNAYFAPQAPHATGMRVIASAKLEAGEFEDNAYFEPFYLKDFVAGKPKKLL